MLYALYHPFILWFITFFSVLIKTKQSQHIIFSASDSFFLTFLIWLQQFCSVVSHNHLSIAQTFVTETFLMPIPIQQNFDLSKTIFHFSFRFLLIFLALIPLIISRILLMQQYLFIFLLFFALFFVLHGAQHHLTFFGILHF